MGGFQDRCDSATITEQGAPGASVLFESSPDESTWTSLGSVVADSTGTARLTFRPRTNLFLRATAPGQTPSDPARGIVRQVATIRPASRTWTTVQPGTTVVFSTTVRPQAGGSAVVRYRIYRFTGSAYTLYSHGSRNTDAAGVGRLAWTFKTPGRWYVMSMAIATPDNASSSWSQLQFYYVR